ncbi:MAG: hypothetical protein HYZ72_11320 [Deltaproteobacteria bacterium]|nr:hypothetical protein [Deltaproteobacteria bacterium]
MTEPVTLEQVAALAAQLPPADRLKLVVYVCEQLSIVLPAVSPEANAEERARQERLAKLDAWLAECEEVAELWEGEFDSAADLRRIRDER